jgi:hypothetical protein
MEALLRIARRHFSDKPMVKVIGLPLRHAERYELVEATTRRVLFDPTLIPAAMASGRGTIQLLD